MRNYYTIDALQRGEIVEFEGVRFRKAQGELVVGDSYIAERNTGPQLLTVKSLHLDTSLCGGWVNPVETAYNYDLCECVKVEFA